MLIFDEPKSQLLRERWERAVRLGVRADGEALGVARSTVYRALRG